VFVKLPTAGRVKTRLQPELSPALAARLCRAMVDDLFRAVDRPGRWDLFAFFSPPDQERAFREWLPGSVRLVPQSGADLGERLTNAFEWSHAQGHSRTIIVGTDMPTLGSDVLSDAFEALERAEVVLGPSTDGGYYLVGLNEPRPELFEDVGWSTPEVLEQTVARIDGTGATCHLLPERTDIDTWQDALIVLEEIVSEDPDGSVGLAPITRSLLSALTEGTLGEND
jgi:rSAM/selenodomain-associated transferase 1